MAFKVKPVPGEWYHCYNRGVEKRITFKEPGDYERMRLLMLTSNSSERFFLSDVSRIDRTSLYIRPLPSMGTPIVDVAGYCLMPNHFHFLLHECKEGGIAKFMQKLLTAYTMYFNKKYERSGPLFSGVYKARHVDSDRYLKQAFAYIHANPLDLIDQSWRDGGMRGIEKVRKQLMAYPYSSLIDYYKGTRPEGALISTMALDFFRGRDDFRRLLSEAIAYHQEHLKEIP